LFKLHRVKSLAGRDYKTSWVFAFAVMTFAAKEFVISDEIINGTLHWFKLAFATLLQ